MMKKYAVAALLLSMLAIPVSSFAQSQQDMGREKEVIIMKENRFQIKVVKEGGDEVVYLIDTEQGRVWKNTGGLNVQLGLYALPFIIPGKASARDEVVFDAIRAEELTPQRWVDKPSTKGK